MTKVKEITKSLVTLQAVMVFKSVPSVEVNISLEDLPSGCKAFQYQDVAVQEEFIP